MKTTREMTKEFCSDMAKHFNLDEKIIAQIYKEGFMQAEGIDDVKIRTEVKEGLNDLIY